MTDDRIEVAGAGDRPKAIATLELSFAADPVMRWFWPDPEVYRATFAAFVSAMAGAAFDHATAWWLDEGRAVALWLPPDVGADDDALTAVIIDSVSPAILEDLSGFADLIREHHPDVSHWYLPITGVDPFVQGKGLGSKLLRHALERCDGDGLPAYLEASTTRSRLLYERFGFRETGSIQVGSSPRVTAMLREPGVPDTMRT